MSIESGAERRLAVLIRLLKVSLHNMRAQLLTDKTPLIGPKSLLQNEMAF